jgi:hypothetical protein
MQRNITVNLGNLVLSLSDAMDLASPLLIQHQQRTASCRVENGESRKLFHRKIGKNFYSSAAS